MKGKLFSEVYYGSTSHGLAINFRPILNGKGEDTHSIYNTNLETTMCLYFHSVPQLTYNPECKEIVHATPNYEYNKYTEIPTIDSNKHSPESMMLFAMEAGAAIIFQSLDNKKDLHTIWVDDQLSDEFIQSFLQDILQHKIDDETKHAKGHFYLRRFESGVNYQGLLAEGLLDSQVVKYLKKEKTTSQHIDIKLPGLSSSSTPSSPLSSPK
ncbi:MAG: hypothetical protein AAGG80_01700, partial [Pseudomonadota bacterium]